GKNLVIDIAAGAPPAANAHSSQQHVPSHAACRVTAYRRGVRPGPTVNPPPSACFPAPSRGGGRHEAVTLVVLFPCDSPRYAPRQLIGLVRAITSASSAARDPHTRLRSGPHK